MVAIWEEHWSLKIKDYYATALKWLRKSSQSAKKIKYWASKRSKSFELLRKSMEVERIWLRIWLRINLEKYGKPS